MLTVSRATLLGLDFGLQMQEFPQTAHPILTNRHALALQLGGDPSIPIGRPLALRLPQPHRKRAFVTPLPTIVVTAARILQHPTQQFERIRFSQLIDHGAFLRVIDVKSREAFFDTSSSNVSWPTKRSNSTMRA